MIGFRLPLHVGEDPSGHGAGFARFQNDSGNVEVAVDCSFDQPVVTDAPDVNATGGQVHAQTPLPQQDDKEGLRDRFKKMTRSFANPLFGDPASSGVGLLFPIQLQFI